MNTKIFTLFVILLFTFSIQAQEWRFDENGKELTNFYDIQKRADTLFAGRETEKGIGYKPYKRWEWHWQSRVLPDGTFPPADYRKKAWDDYARTHDIAAAAENVNSYWTLVGPVESEQGIGRINTVAFHPSDPNTLWVGTAGAGIWESRDDGQTWEYLFKNYPNIGVSGILVHPTNPDIMYVATGDADSGPSQFDGILKTTDGGQNWQKTAMDWSFSSIIQAKDFVMDPNDPNTMHLATNRGMFRSTDGGDSWTTGTNLSVYDIEYKPNSSTEMYASGSNQIFKSNDNGYTWTPLYQIPGSSSRVEIATTAANPDYLYAVSGSSGFTGLFRSTDGGQSFIEQSGSSDLNFGGQIGYNLVCEASQTDPELVYAGAVSLYRSYDGGINWEYGGANMHVDNHEMKWHPLQNTMYNVCDGGVYKLGFDGTYWIDLSDGLPISQIYNLGLSQQDDRLMVGLQDNGVILRNEDSYWDHVIGGDGMECFFSPHDNVMYGEYQNGGMRRSTNNGKSFLNIIPDDAGGGGAWITPFTFHENSATSYSIYCAFRDVFKSDNQGDTWTNLTNHNDNRVIGLMKIAPSDPNFIYYSKQGSIYRTTNGGTSTFAIHQISGNLVDIIIDPSDPWHVWAVYGSNFSSFGKVLESTDGAYTWNDITGTLPNTSMNCMVVLDDVIESKYLGTDLGVFYRDNSMSDWEIFSNQLPIVRVSDMEVRTAEQKIYASTYSHGTWKSDLINRNTTYLSVFPKSLLVNAIPKTSTIEISTDQAWTLSVSPWVTASQNSGTGNASIELTHPTNGNQSALVGQVVVITNSFSEAVQIIQEGTLTPRPDLIVENPDFPINELYPGESTTFLFDIKNIGTQSTTQSFQAEVYLSTDNILSFDDILITKYGQFHNLAVGQSLTSVGNTIILSPTIQPGTYFLITYVDALGKIVEQNESNNELAAVELTVLDATIGCTNNLLQNEGYENGLTNWTGNGAIETNKTHTGINAVRICTSNQSVLQKIPIIPNQPYRFSVQAARDLSGFGHVRFEFLNGNNGLELSSSNTIHSVSYKKYSGILQAPANAVYAQVILRKASGNQCVYADDWCISTINPSLDCEFTASYANVLCNNNGTVNDDSDDTFSFDITINQNGNCGTQWTAERQNVNYGSSFNFGPYAISNGDKSLIISDVQDPSVTQTIVVPAATTCSNGGTTCQNTLIQNAGFENGLGYWSGDFERTTARANTGTASAELCGSNQVIRQTFAATAGEVYDLEVFGLRETSSTYGVLSLKFMDSSWSPIDNKFKSISKMIFNGSESFGAVGIYQETAPSNTAYVEVSVAKTTAGGCIWVDDFCMTKGGGSICTPTASISNMQCDDNGTANDPSDDTYTFDINISQSGICGGHWIKNGVFYPYGQAVNVGPFVIADGNFDFSFSDEYTPSLIEMTSITAPAPCSNSGGGCSISATVSNVVCDPPFVEYDLLVTGQNTATNFGYFVQLDAMDDLFQSRPYNVPVSVRQWVGMNPGTYTFSVFDLDRDTCKAFYSTTCTGGTTCSSNLLQNADFTANGTDWNENLAQHINYISNADAHDGTSVEICGTGARIYQTKQIQGGKTYALQAQVKRSNTAKGLLVIKYMNASWIPVSQDFLTCEDVNYTLETMELAAPTDATWAEVSFYHNGGSGCVYADDFCFSEKTNSGSCAITAEVTNIQCFAMGTPNDPSDDRFAASILVEKNSDCGTFWSNGNGTGSYGTVAFGNLLISDGDVTYTFYDVDNQSTTVTVTAFAPAPCSGGGNQPDLTVENLNLASSSAQVGDVVNFNFDLKNIGNAGASANFTIKSYLSTDQTLSADDIHNGTIPTGFISAGQTVPQTAGALTVPNSLANGQYWVLLKVDADDEIAESEEGNNVAISAGQLTIGTPTASCAYQSCAPVPYLDFTVMTKPAVTESSHGLNYQVGSFTLSAPMDFQRFQVDEKGGFTMNPTTISKAGMYIPTLDGNYLGTSINPTTGALILTLETLNGTVLWTKEHNLNLPTSSHTFHVLEIPNGGFQIVGNAPDLTNNQAINYLLRVNDTGDFVSSSQIDIVPNAPHCTLQTFAFGQNGSSYVTRHIQGLQQFVVSLIKLDATGSELWEIPTLGHTYQNLIKGVMENSDGTKVFVSSTAQSYGAIRCFDAQNGADLWYKNIADLATTTNGIQEVTDFLLPSADGGAVGGFSQQMYTVLSDFIVYKINPDASIAWTLNLDANYDLDAVHNAADGGYFFVGGKGGTETCVLKITHDGQLTPNCDDGGTAPDLELTAVASPLMPGQWKNTSITLTLQNTGTVAATGIVVTTPASMNTTFRDKMAYVNHSTATGTYSEWLGKWNVGSLAAGATATLTYDGFTKAATPIHYFAQVSAQSPADADSAPNNNNTGTPVEDDEALATVNGSVPFVIGNQGKVAVDLDTPVAHVFPNPAKDFLILDLSDFNGKSVDIRLVNSFGQVVLEKQNLTTPRTQLGLEGLQSGSYLVLLRSETYRPVVIKILVEKGW